MIWLLVSIFMSALGQLFLKIASDNAGDRSNMLEFYMSLARNYNLWIGLMSYGVSFLIWLRILTRYDLSFARPMVGLGYVITVLLAIMFLGEKVTLARWIGILLTVSGVVVLSMTNNG